MKINAFILILAVLTCTAPAAMVQVYGQNVWYVDDDAPGDPNPGDPAYSDPLEDGSPDHPFDAIQEAVDAAVDYDAVMILDGTYTGTGNRNIDFNGKDLVAGNLNGPEHCIIDLEGAGQGFIFSIGETDAAIIGNLTIRNGHTEDYGGAVCCENNSHPTIINCVIESSTAKIGGGGISCFMSSPAITNCRILSNSATGWEYWYDGFPVGYWVCLDGFGGGIYCESASPVISNCVIADNTAFISTYHCQDFERAAEGGGIYCKASNPTITNCTIRSNEAGLRGGGIFSGDFSNPLVLNTVLWDNQAEEGFHIWVEYNASLAVQYSNVSGVLNSVFMEAGAVMNRGAGMIDEDPLFESLDPRDGHLSSGSPCINAGSPLYSPMPDETDLDGEDRVLFCRVDMGADETHFFKADCNQNGTADACDIARGLCEDCNGNDVPDGCEVGRRLFDEVDQKPGFQGGDGGARCIPTQNDLNGNCIPDTCEYLSAGSAEPRFDHVIWVDDDAVRDPGPGDPEISDPWEDGTRDYPYDALQEAIDAADEGDMVMVLDGTYRGVGNKNLNLYGRAITVRSLYGPVNCMIDAENDGLGFYFNNGETSATRVEGFTVMNGTGYDDGGYYRGGAVYCGAGSSPTITICVLKDNEVQDRGGAVYCEASDPVISYCIIRDNRCGGEDRGGGIYGEYASPTITNCMIKSCNGSGISIRGEQNSDVEIRDCVVTQNTSSGITCQYTHDLIITNCTITENISEDGGGIECRSSDVQIRDCLIQDNQYLWGGGIYCDTVDSDIRNCTIMNNSPKQSMWSSSGGGIFYTDSTHNVVTIRDCIIADNETESAGGGLFFDDTYPDVTNCTITNNSAENGGGIWIDDGTLTAVNTILWNNQAVRGDQIYMAHDEPDVNISYSDVEDGQSGIRQVSGNLNWGAGMIDADPMFSDPDNLDYHLLTGSPCIDTGDPAFVPDPGETDMDGEDRVASGRVDMGSDEYHE